MKTRSLIPFVCVVVCLNLNGAVWGANGTNGSNGTFPPQNLQVAENTVTEKKEFLLFFEEQDLITATKRPTPLRKAPAIATIITDDDIRNMGARNLLDVLRMVPGLGISINEYNSMMIEVRGIRTPLNEKILFMIDGHSLNKNITGSALYRISTMLPMANIKQVEVVRGPGSALYGNSAFVATINVITRDAGEIDGLEVKAGGGSFDSFEGNLVGGKAIGDKLTVSGSFDYFKTKGPRLTIEADALRARGTADLSDRQIDGFLKIGYGDLSFRGHYLTRRQGLNVGIISVLTDGSSETRLDNYWGELAYNLRLAEGLSASLKLYYDHFEQDPNIKILPDGFTSPAGSFPIGMIGKPLVKDRTIGGELQVNWDPFKGNHLIAGFSYEVLSQYDVKQLGNFDPTKKAPTPTGPLQEVANWNKDATRQLWALYLQDEWQLPARVNLTAGVRYDHYSDFGDTVNPRGGLVWSFLENADLKLLYGQAFRAPNFQELYNINNPALVGNADLKPERIETYEAGLAWRLNRYFAANVNYFYSTIDDQIGSIPATTPNTPAVNANIGKSETQGVEVGVNGAYGPDLYWKLTYAYQDPRDDNTGQRLPYVPSQRATGSVNYALSKYLNLHTDLLWTGQRPRAQGDSRTEVPSHATVDLAVTLKNFYKTLEIQATVRNLFDKRYKDPDTSGALNKVPGDFPREGISVFATASCRF